MSTWPDGTPKSTNNAFNWQGHASTIAQTRATTLPPRSKNLHAKDGTFRIYTKAGAPSDPSVAVPRRKRDTSAPSTET